MLDFYIILHSYRNIQNKGFFAWIGFCCSAQGHKNLFFPSSFQLKLRLTELVLQSCSLLFFSSQGKLLQLKNKLQGKAVTQSEKLEWWIILMVNCVAILHGRKREKILHNKALT